MSTIEVKGRGRARPFGKLRAGSAPIKDMRGYLALLYPTSDIFRVSVDSCLANEEKLWD